MTVIKKNISLREYQEFMKVVYGLSNDRFFGQRDMLINLERFIMRGLKGIRKNDEEKIKLNLLIALSWLMSFLNRLHIDIEKEVWERFPGKCSYCGAGPCVCGKERPTTRKIVTGDIKDCPTTLRGFQEMFEKIYPASERSLEKSGIHLAEEMGELSESILMYGGNSRAKDEFKNIELEAADLFSCFMGVFNSLKIDIALASVDLFKENCHVCKQSPCQCSFDFIMNFKF